MIATIIFIGIGLFCFILGWSFGSLKTYLKIKQQQESHENKLKAVIDANLRFIGDFITLHTVGNRKPGYELYEASFLGFPLKMDIDSGNRYFTRIGCHLLYEETKSKFIRNIQNIVTDGSPENSYNTLNSIWEAEQISDL